MADFETIISKASFPKQRILDFLQNTTIAILGYGIQGRAQAQNLRDQGFAVIVGQRPNSIHYQNALADDWQPQHNLFDLPTAASRADTLYYLLSDGGQAEFWPILKTYLTPGKTLVFAHGFSLVFAEQTKVIVPDGIDVLLVAPKGSGTSLREKFKHGVGFNSSFAVWQDASGQAKEKALAHCFAIGSKYVFGTTFENEVKSDLVSERGMILGGLMGMMEAQYNELRKHGHPPSEAFNDTVEEVTEWLARMIGDIGFDGLLAHCSETAQWGALKWRPIFRQALEPVFHQLYQSVESGEETRNVLQIAQNPKAKAAQQKQIEDLRQSELWQTAKKVRDLRAK